MGFSINTVPYTGGSQTFDLSFALGYIEESDVAVQVVGEVDGTGQPIDRLFVFNSENEIEVIDPLPNPCEVRLVRTVNKENPPVDFSQPGSATREAIELSYVHNLMAVQEALDGRISGSEFTADEALSEIRDSIATSRAWAESDTAPGDTGTKSSKTWAEESEASATAAADSESAASTSASDAATDASTAASAASAASTSESNAATSAYNAALSEAAAEDAETGAEASATSAAGSAGSAASSASAASDSADAASTSESNAASSAGAAASSAGAADTSATEAAQARDDTIAAMVDKVDLAGDRMTGALLIDEEDDGGTADSSLHVKGDTAATSRITLERLGKKGAVGIVGDRLLITGNGDDTNGGIELRATGGSGVAEILGQFDVGSLMMRVSDDATLDPLMFSALAYGAKESNTAAENDTVFSTMSSQLGSRMADLGGRTFPVSATPDLPGAVRGYFEEEDAVGDAALAHPAAMTMLKATTPLTHGLCNSTWAQDNACWDDGLNEGFIAFSENNNHGIEDNSARPVVMRSRDGVSWAREEVDLGFPCTVWGHRVYGGFQMMAVRDESDTGNQGKYYLYGRQLAQRVELTGLENVGASDDRFRFYLSDIADTAHARPVMISETATVQFNGLPSNLGGLDLDGEHTVSFRSSDRYEFRASTDFTSAFTHSGTFEMNVPESDWMHIEFVGNLTLGEALEAAGGGSGEPVLVHGMSMWRDGPGSGGSDDYASRGDFFVGVSGGQFNAAVARINDITDVNGLAEVAFLQEIPGADAALSEVTVQTFPDSDRLCGFIRTQDHNPGQTVPAAFWSTEDGYSNLDTVTLTDLPLGAFEDSPISLTRLGDELVAVATIERDHDGDKGERRLVLLKADIDDAFSTGADAFSIIPFEVAEYDNQTMTGGGAGVGVPSITRWGRNHKVAAAFWNRETTSSEPYTQSTVTQMMATKVSFEPNEMELKGPEHMGWGYVPGPRWNLKLKGAGEVTDGDTLVYNEIVRESAPTKHDLATGVTPLPVSGRYRITVSQVYKSNAQSNYLLMRNEDDTAYVGDGEQWLATAIGGEIVVNFDGSGNVVALEDLVGGETPKAVVERQSAGSSSTTFTAKGGDTLKLVVNASGGTVSSGVRNYCELELLDMF